MTTEGIDVSSHQPTTPPLTGLSFLFARATYGPSPDGRYHQHAAAARAAGLVVGAYHFGINAPVAGQVAAFLATAAGADLFVLDLEAEAGIPRMTDAQAIAFIASIKAKGHKCGLYHSESGYPALGQDWDWVANWGHTPTRPWTFWQYRGSPLDLDRFNGSSAQLRAFAGAAPTGADMPGIALDLNVTHGPDPFPNLGTATVKGSGHDLKRVYDGATGLLNAPAGLNLGIAQRGTIRAPAPSWAPVGTAIVAYTYAGQLHVSPLSDVEFLPLERPADTTPFSQADKDAARSAGYADAKTRAIAAVQTI